MKQHMLRGAAAMALALLLAAPAVAQSTAKTPPTADAIAVRKLIEERFPGATIRQTWGKGAATEGRLTDGEWSVFPPKPGLMLMTNRDVFAVSWQGGGGWRCCGGGCAPRAAPTGR